jgi:hypothetical protein
MGTKRRQTFGVALLGLLLGVALGLVAGWVVWPAQYDQITPALLSGDHQTDYARMVAAAYVRTTDLALARDYLARLGPAATAALRRAATTNANAARLLANLDATSPASDTTATPTTAPPAD